MNNNEYYQKKYLKYKNKYLQLKNKLNQTGSGVNPALATMAMGFGTNMMSNMMSNMITSSNISQNPLLNALPEQQKQFVQQMQQFINPSNLQLSNSVITSVLGNLNNPAYFSILTNIVTNLSYLISHNPNINPIQVLQNLNQLLFEFKKQFPNDFNLIKQFFASNTHNLVPMINSIAPGMLSNVNFGVLIEFFTK